MGAYTFEWPCLELTDEEREYWSVYRTQSGKPGVLRRCYSLRLMNSTIPGEISVPSGPVAGSGRKALVFALTFSGDVQYWSVQIRRASGEQITQNSTSGNGFIPLTALLNVQPNVANAAPPTVGAVAGAAGGSIAALLTPPGMILGRDPPITLNGAEQLIFDGQDTLVTTTPNERSVLNIAVHVWEFPNGPTGVALDAPPRERAPQYGQRRPGEKS